MMHGESMTWPEFLHEANAFHQLSSRLKDNWTLYQHKIETAPNTFLIYKQKLKYQSKDRETGDRDNILQLEYHVVYSVSYQVPVLYFQAEREDGSLLGLEDGWCLFRDAGNYTRDKMLTILTQMDHPVLFRPFLALHPCRTAELLAQFTHGKSRNRILTFISLLGPFVGINLANEYGLPVQEDN